MPRPLATYAQRVQVPKVVALVSHELLRVDGVRVLTSFDGVDRM